MHQAMHMPREIRLIKTIPIDKLTELYKKEANARIKQRLLAITHLYDGKTGVEAAKLVKTSYSSLIRWVERWNAKGYNGLIPGKSTGPKPRLDEGTWNKILDEIKDKGMTLKDVRVYVQTKHGVEYSYDSIWYWTIKKKKTHYGKPYMEDERRPKDAEGILKKG